MRNLFKIDLKNYDDKWEKFVRPSARSIIIKGDKLAMVHSLKYDYYKFPGGGIEKGELRTDALIRETKEESGLTIKEDTIKEYGVVNRKEKSCRNNKDMVLIQDNYYYICEVEEDVGLQKLDDYENEENFTLEFVSPEKVINTNRNREHGPKSQTMIDREASVVELLIKDGYFKM